MQIRVSLTVIILSLFCLIQVVLLYFYAGADEKQQRVIVYLGTTVGGAFALFVYLRAVEDRRSQSAEKLIERWNHPGMASYKDIGRDIRRGVLSIGTMTRVNQNSDFEEPHKKHRSELLGLLGFYEEISLAIRTKSANEETLRRFFEAVMAQTYHKTKEWIDKERTLDNEQGYYEEFQKVVESWAKRSSAV